jgi:hypothetical protein
MTARRALNRVTKWRAHFAAWQLGTRAAGDPECQAVRDHRELSILLRTEMSALTGLLMRKGVITAAEYDAALEREASDLAADYAKRWPGVSATDDGLAYDLAQIRDAGWMQGWLP